MACEHLPAAWQAVSRWRTLAPDDREANAMYAARGAEALSHRGRARRDPRLLAREAQPAQRRPRRPPTRCAARRRTAARRRASAAARPGTSREVSMTELAPRCCSRSRTHRRCSSAMSGALEPHASSPQTLSLLGDLAFARLRRRSVPSSYARQALERDPKDLAALRVLARAYVMQGMPRRPRHGARGRSRRCGARRVRAGGSARRARSHRGGAPGARASALPRRAAAEIDRRLALLAFKSGDMKEAQQRFTELVSSGEGERRRAALSRRHRGARRRPGRGHRRLSPALRLLGGASGALARRGAAARAQELARRGAGAVG